MSNDSTNKGATLGVPAGAGIITPTVGTVTRHGDFNRKLSSRFYVVHSWDCPNPIEQPEDPPCYLLECFAELRRSPN